LRHGETAAGLFERADAALRRSKDAGKNRATTASE
jgi:PleD family two-component response regulator